MTVGKDTNKKVFSVHADILSSASEQWEDKVKDALASDSKTVSMEGDDPKPFGLFLEYRYSNSLASKDDIDISDYVDLAQLYTFAYKHRMSSIQSGALEIFGTFPGNWEGRRLGACHYDHVALGHFCKVLEVVLKELPPMSIVDPLRAIIFEVFLRNAHYIQHHEAFRKLAEEFPGLEESLGLELVRVPGSVDAVDRPKCDDGWGEPTGPGLGTVKPMTGAEWLRRHSRLYRSTPAPRRSASNERRARASAQYMARMGEGYV